MRAIEFSSAINFVILSNVSGLSSGQTTAANVVDRFECLSDNRTIFKQGMKRLLRNGIRQTFRLSEYWFFTREAANHSRRMKKLVALMRNLYR